MCIMETVGSTEYEVLYVKLCTEVDIFNIKIHRLTSRCLITSPESNMSLVNVSSCSGSMVR